MNIFILCAYLLFWNVCLRYLKCIWFAVMALCEALVMSCFPDFTSGSRSFISNVVLQGVNQMLWSSKKYPTGCIQRIKVFYDEMWSSLSACCCWGVSAFSCKRGNFLDESLRSVSGLRDLVLYVVQPDPTAPVDWVYESCSVKQVWSVSVCVGVNWN